MTIQSIIRWFEIAKPEPTLKDLSTQIGCHFEEVAEMAECLGDNNLATKLNTVSHAYKQNVCGYGGDKVALLDALCDQIVTALGVGVLMGFDMEKALAEVNRSNYTKFAKDKQGNYVPYIKLNGKIGKNPDTYQEPKLNLFTQVRSTPEKWRLVFAEIIDEIESNPTKKEFDFCLDPDERTYSQDFNTWLSVKGLKPEYIYDPLFECRVKVTRL